MDKIGDSKWWRKLQNHNIFYEKSDFIRSVVYRIKECTLLCQNMKNFEAKPKFHVIISPGREGELLATLDGENYFDWF